jgi:hypothetical protein
MAPPQAIPELAKKLLMWQQEQRRSRCRLVEFAIRVGNWVSSGSVKDLGKMLITRRIRQFVDFNTLGAIIVGKKKRLTVDFTFGANSLNLNQQRQPGIGQF